MTPELEAIAQRVEELEKQVAHLAAVMTEQSDPDRAIEARSFVVRDEQGQRRAELGLTIPVGLAEPHPWLALFDANESVRACMGAGPKGPWLELYNEKRNVGVEIDFDENNLTLRLFSENGKPTVAVQTSEFGPLVALFDPDGKQQLSISISLSGEPSLVMENGDQVTKLTARRDGPQLMFGKDNKVFWSAPT